MANLLRAAMRLLYRTLPPKQSLQVQYAKALGRWPDLDNPKTFNEHVQAFKLAPRNPLLPLLADKVQVKEWVAERVGRDVVIPTLWTGKVLPATPPCATPFVVKANHSSGWNHFVRAVDPAEWLTLRETSKEWLATDWYPYLHEWWYNEIERLLLIEPMIGEELNDYKFFCFDGEVKVVQVDGGRFTDHRRSFYDRDWKLQPFELAHDLIDGDVPRPRHFARMIELAETLSTGFAFVRIDFYDLEAGPMFGEMTFAPGAGFERFSPDSADVMFGDWWKEAAQRTRRDDRQDLLRVAG
ncbi:hypothetical protein ASE95_08510 [Sphingomonas sp. Leaf231]|uniref:ATP-grasp fold amidoligase family protein n=1 Tax=Sphingomonas sp. Leaf231 TaxID=1736301 RepID=UPI0006F735A4|nr:ATP-grasp fold amidoligase family protein [Sphingomonas sp. Leaf231]KQN92702.1 hypothetical protein ASE95_08510 [Sphingomonas sp. Leaf231]